VKTCNTKKEIEPIHYVKCVNNFITIACTNSKICRNNSDGKWEEQDNIKWLKQLFATWCTSIFVDTPKHWQEMTSTGRYSNELDASKTRQVNPSNWDNSDICWNSKKCLKNQKILVSIFQLQKNWKEFRKNIFIGVHPPVRSTDKRSLYILNDNGHMTLPKKVIFI